MKTNCLVESKHVSFDERNSPRSNMADESVVVYSDDHHNERTMSRNNEELSVNQKEGLQKATSDEITMNTVR